ncbi:hypothetical protein [Streptomyces eurocidicus]|uniref:DUF5602 domain-containing protein n=1 Tax=Streptomyces eurocidicus TaxID=66423 RepID=A0A7W8BCD5_STREU|nr:hypothetical protein [Streptomyces eurocidicus]MBB5118904.1 hypothetical protein [Streptomyces eurocidicus]MBF6051290.1 hypothetical protein [Streptomyces eurocidicus]
MQTAPLRQSSSATRGRRARRAVTAALAAAALLGAWAAADTGRADDSRSAATPAAHGRVKTEYGTPQRLGDGTIRVYSQRRGSRPLTLGYTFSAAALRNLPKEGDGKICYDVNGDGTVDRATECVDEVAMALDLPEGFRGHVGGPFTWAQLTWDPHGHPPEAYSVPHFDFHFYMQDEAAVRRIRTGPCAGLMNCDDLKTARKPVPERYMPDRYMDMGAVVPQMGNHLMDMDSPEMHGKPFTQTFMYGAYDSRITFYEPMIAKSWIEGLAHGRAGGCAPVNRPKAWAVSGWYPTTYCMDYRRDTRQYTVSLSGFTHREATP